MKLWRVIGISVGMLSLAGCFSPAELPQVQSYTLNSPKVQVAKATPTNHVLLLLATQASPAFSSNKMAYTNKTYEQGYFTKHQWVAPPAEQLTPLIAHAIQQTHHFKAVVTAPYVGQVNYRLNTRLLKLQQNFLQQPSHEQLTLLAQLVQSRTGKVMAEKQFAISVPTQAQTPYGGVVAANRAVQQLLQQLTRFVVAHT